MRGSLRPPARAAPWLAKFQCDCDRRGVALEQLDYYRARALEYDKWWNCARAALTAGPRQTRAGSPRRRSRNGCWSALIPAATCWSWPAAPACGRATSSLRRLCHRGRRRPGSAGDQPGPGRRRTVSYVQADLFGWRLTGATTPACSPSGSRTSRRSLRRLLGDGRRRRWRPGAASCSSTAPAPNARPPPTICSPGRRRHDDAPAGRRPRVQDRQALLRPGRWLPALAELGWERAVARRPSSSSTAPRPARAPTPSALTQRGVAAAAPAFPEDPCHLDSPPLTRPRPRNLKARHGAPVDRPHEQLRQRLHHSRRVHERRVLAAHRDVE